jgi:hypothetical protein
MRKLDESASKINSSVIGTEFPYGKSRAMLEEPSRYVVAGHSVRLRPNLNVTKDEIRLLKKPDGLFSSCQ